MDQAATGTRSAGKDRIRARRMSPEDRRKQILACAIEIFAEKGIATATHADVAERAGVSIPTVFHYYPSIEQLQTAVLMDVHRFLLDGFVLSRLQDDRPAFDRIEEMLLTFREAIDSNRDYVSLWLEWSGVTRGRTWDLYMDFYRETVGAIRKLLLQGRKDGSMSADINATEAARVVLGMAHTIAHMRFSGSSHRAVQNMVHNLVMSLLAA